MVLGVYGISVVLSAYFFRSQNAIYHVMYIRFCGATADLSMMDKSESKNYSVFNRVVDVINIVYY